MNAVRPVRKNGLYFNGAEETETIRDIKKPKLNLKQQ